MIEHLFAGAALGIALASYFGVWWLNVRSRRHWEFMYSCLEARLSILEDEFNRHYSIDHNDKHAEG
jgi:hypothetical protein